ncbi:MAG: hypothetical protein WBD74_13160 [Candidatus Aquilonibacter sp.]
MNKFAFVTVVTVLAVLCACGRSSNVSTQSAASGAPAAPGGSVLVTAGTQFRSKLQNGISTKKSHDGDTFTIVRSDGAIIDGHLAGVSPAGLGKKPALTVVFDDVRLPDGEKAPINVQLVNVGAFDAQSHHWRTIGMVLGGGTAGHIAAGKHHGGLLGAASGYMLSQEMKTDVDVKPGTVVAVKFVSDAVAQTSPAPSAQ